SPFDRLAFAAYQALSIGHFMRGRYEEAANAARRAVQSNEGFSLSHMFLAAALAKLGRLADANAAASRVLALQPNFTIGGLCAGLAILAAGGLRHREAGPFIELEVLGQLQVPVASTAITRVRTDPARRSPRWIRPLRSSRRCSRVSDADRRSQVPGRWRYVGLFRLPR